MKSVSKAGFLLLRLVSAAIGYGEVYKEVRPKKERVIILKRELKVQQDNYETLQKTISEMEQKLANLKKEYEFFTAQKEQFKEMLKMIERRLTAANRLIVGLITEQNRWDIELEKLRNDNVNIIGNCLLSSAFMSYLGAMPLPLRNALLYEDWLYDIKDRGVLVDESFRIENQLTNDVEVSVWTAEGLHQDEFSIQNGILTTKGSRYPLCIDPHEQAASWIKKREFNNNLKIISFKDQNYLTVLEEGIQFGFPVLIQNIDGYIDPLLESLLEKKFKCHDDKVTVMIGSKETTVDEKFKLYLTTKISRPNFSSVVYAKTLVINFCITMEGLEEQLLGVVVRSERIDLEEEKELLIEEIGINKQILSTLNDSLLRELTKTSENMLDNIELIETLESTKLRASQVNKKIDKALMAAKSIDSARNAFKPVAQRGAVLFFVLSEISFVNPMYQYSLAFYITLFKRSIVNASHSGDFAERLNNILETMKRDVYNYISIGLFANDKLLFSFQMTSKLQQLDGKLHHNELDFFLQCSTSSNKFNCESPVKWMTQKQWGNIIKLSEEFSESFGFLPHNIQSNLSTWKEWYDSECPEIVDCPGELFKETINFQVTVYYNFQIILDRFDFLFNFLEIDAYPLLASRASL